MHHSSLHPMDAQWDAAAKQLYKQAYPDLVRAFRQIIGRGFLRCKWIPDPLALDYLTKVLIRFLPVEVTKHKLEEALGIAEEDANDPREIIRFYEMAGEMILWWSGVYRQAVYQEEGKRSYTIAYEQLQDYEIPTKRFIVKPGDEEPYVSKRLKLNKMFSEQFENYQEILENTEIINDPVFAKYRTQFMTDDFSIN